MKYLLDTDICIYIARKRPASASERFARLKSGDVGISLITYGELLFGVRKSRQAEAAQKRLDRFVQLVPVVLPTEAVARHYADIRAALERSGTPIGANDYWIAAQARAEDLVLVSNNLREFSRIPGLRLENWVESS